SSAPYENKYTIAVKEIENGRVSGYINRNLKEGDVVEVMPPMGNFTYNFSPDNSKHYLFFAAGSGITPVISLIKQGLHEEPNSKFTLFFSNKTEQDIIYKNELEELAASHPNFKIYHVFTRQACDNKVLEGRINKQKCFDLMEAFPEIKNADEVFVCGPEPMILEVKKAFTEKGYQENQIHFELFTTPTQQPEALQGKTETDFQGKAHVIVIMDGEEYEFDMDASKENILDAAIEHGVDAPFSCKGAVCCTCKAKVMEGKAVMDMNYALTDEEVEEGYVLTCQAHPATPKVVVDYDEI
ncbi:MAG: phenylacetic acid degradation protein, partial [Bacteroidetes bacterium]